MKNDKAEEIRMGARFCTSKEEYLNNPDRWMHMAEDQLRMKMAYEIQKEKGKIIETDNMIEKRLDLYVATPDTFWGIVRQEAMRIATQFPSS
jgi:hypothetical protein